MDPNSISLMTFSNRSHSALSSATQGAGSSATHAQSQQNPDRSVYDDHSSLVSCLGYNPIMPAPSLECSKEDIAMLLMAQLRHKSHPAAICDATNRITPPSQHMAPITNPHKTIKLWCPQPSFLHLDGCSKGGQGSPAFSHAFGCVFASTARKPMLEVQKPFRYLILWQGHGNNHEIF